LFPNFAFHFHSEKWQEERKQYVHRLREQEVQ
jgi:hypothetical protein